jgi:predicted ATPase
LYCAAPRNSGTIDRLHVENFKSIREVDVEFSDLNVFVGRNAAGKSNLFEVFQFLRDARDVGLDDAVQLQGGTEYLKNLRMNSNQNLKIEIDKNKSVKKSMQVEIGFDSNSYSPVIDKYKIKDVEDDRNSAMKGPSIELVDFLSDKSIGFPENEIHFLWNDLKRGERAKVQLSKIENTERDMVIDTTNPVLSPPDLGRTYDIRTKKIQQPTTLKGKTELEPDGSNLALVIRNIVEDEEQKEKFVTLVSDVLPFVSDSDVETMPDQSLFLKILEEFEPGQDQYIPASMLSDGTLRVLATIVLLYFSDEETIFIEEPGRNVHPSLIANLMAKIRDVTENTDKQVFITTHNVEVVRNAPLESIRLVSRGDDGFTQVEQPAKNERVQTFLENGMGIGELYTENLLGE